VTGHIACSRSLPVNPTRPRAQTFQTLLLAGSCAALLIACGDGATGTTSGGGGSTSSASGTGGDTSTSTASGQGGQLPNVIEGTIDGKTITVMDSVFLFDSRNGANWFALYMENAAGSCDRVKADQFKQNTDSFGFSIVTSAPVGPGTYAVGKSGTDTQLNGGITPADPTCKATPHYTKSGSVTITLLTATQAAGTFDITFDNDDHITGSFGADHCEQSPFDIGMQTCVP
jgi:hypothetical protein